MYNCKAVALIIFFVLCLNLKAQVYPSWFLNQDGLCNGQTIIGYAHRGFQKDTSAMKLAFEDACKRYLDYNLLSITGNDKFWNTGSGTVWVGTDIRRDYDTCNFDNSLIGLVPVDTFKNKKFILILFAKADCPVNTLNSSHAGIPAEAPKWASTQPADMNYYYTVGVSEQYYYEMSSWQKSEENALLQLAKQMNSEVSSLQKSDQNIEEKLRANFTAKISGFQVVSRWKDSKKHLYYTLARLPKQ